MFSNGKGLVKFGGRSERTSAVKGCPHLHQCITWEGCNAKSERRRRDECNKAPPKKRIQAA